MHERYDIKRDPLYIYHTNLTVVCACVCLPVHKSRRSSGAIQPELKTSLYLESCSWDATPNSPLIQPAMTPAACYRKSASQEPPNKIIIAKSRLTCGSLVMAKELDLGVDVMYGCFTKGGDCILGVFSWELLRAKL